MKKAPFDFTLDLLSLASLIGIWPRFIEPYLLKTTKIALPIEGLPQALQGLKIAHLSDLHFRSITKDAFLDKIVHSVEKQAPDLIVFTGDFLCYACLADAKRLQNFLNRFHAPFGCFAVLGNHDLSAPLSINEKGDYDCLSDKPQILKKIGQALFRKTVLTKKVTERASQLIPHVELLELLQKTPFQLLHNKTKLLNINGTHLNITGLGEYMARQDLGFRAFIDYHPEYKGIILLHNPDGAKKLIAYPGDVILSGHTHGGQVNLPFIWKKLTLLEDQSLKGGLKRFGKKWIYINRGLSGVVDFRFFSMPEVLFLTLVAK